MLLLLSPAKNMNFDPAPDAPRATKPVLMKDVKELAETTRKLTRGKLKSLMGISDKLADLNYERFQAFSADSKADGAKQAALAFNGDVYLGLDAQTLGADDLAFAQDHLRILSGLYGVLRPLDAIEPYRLEMGSRLKNPRGATLYDFWGASIAKELNKAAKGADDPTIVNLASNEYFSAVDRDALKAPIVTPVFKEEKDGKLRQLQFFAKRARGAMARWAIRNRITRAEDLKGFKEDGYKFREGDSSDDLWLFARPQPPKKT
ncbi:MAG: peroxide stress protein YaaA [Pseudomonadota bacterium]